MYIYRLAFLLVIALYFFSPLGMDILLGSGETWYRPYIVWLATILLLMWIESRRGTDDL